MIKIKNCPKESEDEEGSKERKEKYGTKYYIHPSKWADKNLGKKIEKKEEKKLETNSMLSKLLQKYVPKKGGFDDESPKKLEVEDGKDSVEEFEDQMMKVLDVEKEDD